MIECIPNISEGRDVALLSAICKAIEDVPGVALLHRDIGFDANRTVLTFVGERTPLKEAVLAMYAIALHRIDLRNHTGTHPRIGAIDVCPFVPLQGSNLNDALELAEEVAKEIAAQFSIPVFLYEKSAKAEYRRRLYDIRRGEFEGLRDKLSLSEWQPDFGPSAPHETFGATVIGARDFLVAFNVSLETKDVQVARNIARELRELRHKPSLNILERKKWNSVRAIGWSTPSYGCVQVSTNIVDIDLISLVDIYREIERLAADEKIKIVGSELIGLVPERVLKASMTSLGKEGDNYSEVVDFLGLSSHREFILDEHILERAHTLSQSR